MQKRGKAHHNYATTHALTLHKETPEARAGIRLEDGDNGFVRIVDVDPTGPLCNAVQAGDYLMTINDERCTEFQQAVRTLKASHGDVRLLIARIVKLPRRASLASSGGVTVVLKKKSSSSPLGVKLEDGVGGGARIGDIDPAGPVAKMLRVGDHVLQVNDVPVSGYEHAVRMLRAAEGDVRLVIRPYVRHGPRRIFERRVKSMEVEMDSGIQPSSTSRSAEQVLQSKEGDSPDSNSNADAGRLSAARTPEKSHTAATSRANVEESSCQQQSVEVEVQADALCTSSMDPPSSSVPASTPVPVLQPAEAHQPARGAEAHQPARGAEVGGFFTAETAEEASQNRLQRAEHSQLSWLNHQLAVLVMIAPP